MPYNPSNFHQQQRGNLDYLYESLGIRELFERVAELDGGPGPMDIVDENPTGNPAVQPNMEGVGTYSGGPNAENDGSMATHDPNLIEKIKKDAEEAEKKDYDDYEEEEEVESTKPAEIPEITDVKESLDTNTNVPEVEGAPKVSTPSTRAASRTTKK